MKYRIRRDDYSGYEVQWKGWFFWRMRKCNTHGSIEKAEEYARKHCATRGYRTPREVISEGECS